MSKSNNSLGESRRKFLQNASLLIAALPLAKLNSFAAPPFAAEATIINTPQTLVAEPRLHLSFGAERMVMNDGLQPSMLCTKKGTLIVQSQLSTKPLPSQRIFYPYAIQTVISRDGGNTWKEFPLKPGENGVNMEGGAIQLRNGEIIALETYVTPGKSTGEGAGLLYSSKDDWKTLDGPEEITFNIPGANFHGSTDDGGRPHASMRLHRRIMQLPNSDLLTTIYGWVEGHKEPSGYTFTMKKTRVMLFRSTSKGLHWDYVSTIAVDPKVGTEGFGEPVIVRVSKGVHKGRLICQMRTGRDLYEAISEDEGRTWSKSMPRVFANFNVYKTDEWAQMFEGVKRGGVLVKDNPNEFISAMVDPDLLELRNGILVAAFGLRIPARANFANPKHPWNGNYLAFSLDGGDTWGHVVRMTSGVSTTHYMAVEETPKDNNIFVVYD